MKAFTTTTLLILIGCATPQFKNNNQENASEAVTSFEYLENQNSKENAVSENTILPKETGFASWYGKELQGKPTASGELFDMHKYTAAHRTYPMGSLVLIKNNENGRKQLLRVNDRGPYVEGRIIDVSFAAARDLGFAEKGTAQVEIELIEKGKDNFLSKADIPAKNISESIYEPFEESDEENEFETNDNEIMSNNGEYVFIDGISPNGYTVQVGAFFSRANAEKFRMTMKTKYNKSSFIASRGKWHFVWLGDFSSKEKARAFFETLRKHGEDVYYRGKSS
ncbi:MAG: septal ring lytic transglycosylase RlpA family protein [Spirochaetia bacterium]|nr:septal ring lytic transglycosylase RlpA family protein [Spirochaetia bacterium]